MKKNSWQAGLSDNARPPACQAKRDSRSYWQAGQSLIELLLALSVTAIILPALLTGLVTSRAGKPQEEQRLQATALLQQTEEAVRNIREKDWNSFALDGTYHPVISGSSWVLAAGSATASGLTQQLVISDVYRNNSDAIVASNSGILDNSTKQVIITVSWNLPYPSFLQATTYLTRYLDNISFTDTTVADFNLGIKVNTQVTNTSGGEVTLANNNKAKWCSPALSSATIDLPDGPPIAVAAQANGVTTSIPNDVFVATSPYATSSVKLAYLNVTANTDIPVPSLQGTFTLDSTKYSSSGLVPSGLGFTNSFTTTDVKYYTSTGGNLYALLGTNMPNKEVIVIQVKSGGNNSFQDPTNHIYKYWTFFNTRQYQGDSRSTPNQDQSPFGYGAESVVILGNTGYVASGGYLYAFDLSSIDSKSASSGLDMLGCRIELDGYDCQPGNGTDMKYSAGSSNQTGTNWGNTTSPAHNNCSDGGNIELYADHQLSGVTIGSNNYIYVAVGAGTDPELDIVNATSVPTTSSSPKISSNNCGGISGGNSGWKRIGSLDFDTKSNTEEAANSVYAKSDGTRAYMSSNGGIDANGDGIPDSDQFYIIDTTNKSAPKFLSTSSSGNGSVATSGYYNGNSTNIELYPRRSLTVLNGERAVLVGQDGIPNDGIEPQEYQVINIDPADPSGNLETSPAYCGGINFLPGFNDLTSVSEADGDNFVYMVANTNEKQLKIIQGGPDSGIYVPSGTFESRIFTSSFSAAFNHFTATVSQPSSTTIKAQVAVASQVSGSCSGATFNYVGPGGTAGSSPSAYFTPVGNIISGTVPFGAYGGYQNPNQCFRYKYYLDTSDASQTPVLNDMTVNYSP